jgi:hypothetical protein
MFPVAVPTMALDALLSAGRGKTATLDPKQGAWRSRRQLR